MRKNKSVIFGGILGFLIYHSYAPSVDAAEQVCNTLGTNCVCSEPFNTTSHTYTTPVINPSDSTTKQCNTQGHVNAGATRNTNDITWASAVTHPTIFSALPSGHQITNVMKGANGHVGIFWLGGKLGSGNFIVQAAIRLYIFHSSDFEFSAQNLCENHKRFETEHIITTMVSVSKTGTGGGVHHSYGYVVPGAWNHTVECCSSGPNTINNFGPTPANTAYRGKWYRHEMVLTNRAGGSSPNGLNMQYYLRNITDDLAETKVLDLRGTFAGGLESWGAWTDLTPTTRQDTLSFAAYRQGTCAGYYAFSHLIVAGWNTTGNRIGAASEIEGVGPTAPTAPSNLKVQQSNLLRRFIRPATHAPVRWH